MCWRRCLRGGYAVGVRGQHIILSGYATTGDGQLTAAKVLSLLAKYPEQRVSELFSVMQPTAADNRQCAVPASMSPDDRKKLISVGSIAECAERVTAAAGRFGQTGASPLRHRVAYTHLRLRGECESQLTTYAEEPKSAILAPVESAR